MLFVEICILKSKIVINMSSFFIMLKIQFLYFSIEERSNSFVLSDSSFLYYSYSYKLYLNRLVTIFTKFWDSYILTVLTDSLNTKGLKTKSKKKEGRLFVLNRVSAFKARLQTNDPLIQLPFFLSHNPSSTERRSNYRSLLWVSLFNTETHCIIVKLCSSAVYELMLIFGKHKTFHETLIEFQFYHLKVKYWTLHATQLSMNVCNSAILFVSLKSLQ